MKKIFLMLALSATVCGTLSAQSKEMSDIYNSLMDQEERGGQSNLSLKNPPSKINDYNGYAFHISVYNGDKKIYDAKD